MSASGDKRLRFYHRFTDDPVMPGSTERIFGRHRFRSPAVRVVASVRASLCERFLCESFSVRAVPADSLSVTLLRACLRRRSRSVVIHCHYAIVVRGSRILPLFCIFPVYCTFDRMKTPVSRRTHAMVGVFKTNGSLHFRSTDVFESGE